MAGWADEYYTQKLDEITTFFGGRYKSFPWMMKKVFSLSEPYDVSIQYKNCGMLRVLNATEALRMYPWTALPRWTIP